MLIARCGSLWKTLKSPESMYRLSGHHQSHITKVTNILNYLFGCKIHIEFSKYTTVGTTFMQTFIERNASLVIGIAVITQDL